VAAGMQQAALRTKSDGAGSLADTAQAEAMLQRISARLGWDHALARQASTELSEEEVAQFYRKNPGLFTPLTPVRVAKLTLDIADPGLATHETALSELGRVSAQLRQGQTPAGAEPPGPPDFFVPSGVLEDRAILGGLQVEQATPAEISAALGRATTPLLTTETLSGLFDRSDLPMPVATDETSIPALRPLSPSPASDAPTTAPQGGGEPRPASGGLARTEPNIPDFAASQPDRPGQPARPIPWMASATKYQSSLYRLTAVDLGWIILEDHPEIPRAVARLAPGQFTRPKETLRGAEAWQVTEKLQAQPMPLERVRFEAEDALIAAKYRRLRASELSRAARATGVGSVASPAAAAPSRESTTRRTTRDGWPAARKTTRP
jgi:hypothetical protein